MDIFPKIFIPSFIHNLFSFYTEKLPLSFQKVILSALSIRPISSAITHTGPP